jgi:hypothetical protein
MLRCHRTSLLDFLFSCFGLYPYACESCARRSYRPRLEQILLIGAATILCVAAGLVCSGARPGLGMVNPELSSRMVQTPFMRDARSELPIRIDVLGNADVMRLVQAHLSGALIIKLIASAPHDFQIDTNSLIALKESGTPDDVIESIILASKSAPVLTPRPPEVQAVALRDNTLESSNR